VLESDPEAAGECLDDTPAAVRASRTGLIRQTRASRGEQVDRLAELIDLCCNSSV